MNRNITVELQIMPHTRAIRHLLDHTIRPDVPLDRAERFKSADLPTLVTKTEAMPLSSA